jgi:preprotein translocase subunit SecE
MAVAEARKMDNVEGGGKPKPEGGGKPAWLSEALTWGPRKFRELRTFFSEVKSELKKVTWPPRQEVMATTVVVIATTVFFGFYLWGLDLGLSVLFSRVMGAK